MRLLFALLVLPLSACASARAQGPVTWATPLGPVAYGGPDGAASVLEYTVPFGDNIGRMYVDGLSEDFRGAGPLKGYWSEPDVSHDDEDDNTLICPFVITDGHGRTTRNWGQITVAFTGGFPGKLVVRRGRCFEAPEEVVRGKVGR